MTPTNRLRFVERAVLVPEYGEGIGKNVRILQQWWEDKSCDVHVHGSPTGSPGEWKDVPIEKENNNG